MLNGIIQTMIICMGMSINGMPVCDYSKKYSNQEIKTTLTPKKANGNEEHTYTLNATTGSTTQTNYESLYYLNKENINGSNSYLNVIGTSYTQWAQQYVNTTSGSQRVKFYGNAYYNIEDQETWNTHYPDRYLGENADLNNTWGTYIQKSLIILKITPYQFNVETTIRVKFTFELKDYETTTEDYYNYEIYLKYRNYKSVIQPNNTGLGQNNSFDKYIGLQNAKALPNTIEREIVDPNENYYYDRTYEIQKVGNNTVSNQWIEKTFEINITPGMDNYFVFSMIPIVRPVYDTTGEMVTRTGGGIWISPNTNTIKITGTNIIPSGTQEVIDLPGLCFEILGMPFAFISQAFNLTLFPGTQYQINLSNLFLALIALAIFIFLMKLLLMVINKVL